MQITDFQSDGLKREFKVTVPAGEIDQAVESRLQELGKRVKMPGFRPGKIPTKVLKMKYGKSVMGEVLEQTTNRITKEALDEKEVKPALPPNIEITSYDEGKDLECSIVCEVLPELPEVKFEEIELEKPVCEVTDEQLDEELKKLAELQVSYEAPSKARKAKKGDALIVSFKGTVDGEAFEGGEAEGFRIVLGSGSLIPGFEDQLVGLQPGDEKTVKVTFPENYGNNGLAGKDAEFEVKVQELLEPQAPELDDELAKKFGFEDLAELKVRLRNRMEEEHREISRARMKKDLFDYLDENYEFEVPQGMFDMEFEQIWNNLQQAKAQGDPSLQKSDEELREEYEAICMRRVRLGVLLSEIGKGSDVKVNPEDLQKEISRQAMQYPGQEQKVVEFYQKNPREVENLQGAVFEEKVVDYILDKVKQKEKKVSLEEFTKGLDDESEQARPKKAKKKASGSKAAKKTSGGKAKSASAKKDKA